MLIISSTDFNETRIGSRNKAKIRSAALKAFGNDGFKGASLDDIASRCKISKPNILYYFSNKEELYREVLEQVLLKLISDFPDFFHQQRVSLTKASKSNVHLASEELNFLAVQRFQQTPMKNSEIFGILHPHMRNACGDSNARKELDANFGEKLLNKILIMNLQVI